MNKLKKQLLYNLLLISSLFYLSFKFSLILMHINTLNVNLLRRPLQNQVQLQLLFSMFFFRYIT